MIFCSTDRDREKDGDRERERDRHRETDTETETEGQTGRGGRGEKGREKKGGMKWGSKKTQVIKAKIDLMSAMGFDPETFAQMPSDGHPLNRLTPLNVGGQLSF